MTELVPFSAISHLGLVEIQSSKLQLASQQFIFGEF